MYTYYQLIKNSKAPGPYRAAIVKYAIKHGNKPAASMIPIFNQYHNVSFSISEYLATYCIELKTVTIQTDKGEDKFYSLEEFPTRF